MDPERPRATVASRYRGGAVLARLAGGGVPDSLRLILEAAFTEPTPEGRLRTITMRRGSFGDELVGLSLEDWRGLAATLVPQLGPSVAAALVALAHRPYLEGLLRLPFRSQTSASSLADARARWLLDITVLVGDYDADIHWIAEHGAELAGWNGGAEIGWLLAGAIDAGDADGEAVFQRLRASAFGDNESTPMGRHVIQALLSCARPDAWESVERLLLSAQREEGLRQAILESVDEAHPDAFRSMLRRILDDDLARFSSVVRAADTWFGFMWDGSSAVKIGSLLQRVLRFLDDPGARTEAFGDDDAETVYLALWSHAFTDVDGAIPNAARLMQHARVEHRFIGVHFLVQTLWTEALPTAVDALGDPDLRVASRALDLFGTDMTSVTEGTRLFSQLEGLLARVPKRSQKLEPLVWPWGVRKLERSTVAAAMAAIADAVPGERLLPYVPELDPYQRMAFVRRVAGLRTPWEAEIPGGSVRRMISSGERVVIVDLLGDTSAEVRIAAFSALERHPVEQDEIDRLIDLLARKPGDLRNGALARLGTLADDARLAAADRLIADTNDQRRLAGLELLRDAVENGIAVSESRDRVARYAAGHASLSDQERAHVDAVAGGAAQVPTVDDALGLLAGRAQRHWPAPREMAVELDTAGARASLAALASLILEHQTVEIRTASGEMKLLVESVPWGFGLDRRGHDDGSTVPPPPLAEVWRGWLLNRPDTQRDPDGLELLRVLVTDESRGAWQSEEVRQARFLGRWNAGANFLRGVLDWCVAWDPPTAAGTTFLLDGLEGSLAAITDDDYRDMAASVASGRPEHSWYGSASTPSWRHALGQRNVWLKRFRWWRGLMPSTVSEHDAVRLYQLLRAFEARSGGYGMLRLTLNDFVPAYASGALDEDEFVDLLVGRFSHQARSSILRAASARKPSKELIPYPALQAVVDRCRRRVVDVEAARGDRVSAASGLAMELRWTGGLDTLQRAIPALGKSHFLRNFSWSESGASRQETLSHLVVRSLPRDEDTPEAFAHWARLAKLSEARLLELAVYAPQWSAHVSHTLGWPAIDGAVWWIQAHTKDDRSWQLKEMKELWAAEMSEQTALAPADLTEGAVDVAWFQRVYAVLGPERWKALDTAAKYAASAGGHTRAQLFARAMAGMVTRDDLLARITASRHQDSVRAIGLVPLAPGEARDADLQQRYHILEEFRRTARQFGAQRKVSESRATDIGMANLARTAGFRDPQRLRWAMERAAIGDLVRGPLILTRGDVLLTLSVDEDGVPALTTVRAGTPLKSLPAALKKDAEVVALKERHQDLKRQRSRVRDSLEEAMCRGDVFTAAELRTLCEHPILAPALRRLVFIGEGLAGYLVEDGRALRDHGGVLHPLGTAEEVRIAHPADLLALGDWSAWQRECYAAERIQPFKQVFRELYPMTRDERGTDRSRRYAGHQLNPGQAMAVIGGRGWIARAEEGVSRTFHDAGLVARLGFQETFYTPADVDGLTLEDVVFTAKGDWRELPLADVPARVFSEAMRDLDLVVSVAHRGGVDPEATASTVEMRANLVRETCALLGLANVELTANHAIIRGSLAEYSVHLGSAGVLVLPAYTLPIVAVHSQHRGRMFLPFADDDPRTAEVLSKVLLLARDTQIRDPGILESIRAARGSVAH